VGRLATRDRLDVVVHPEVVVAECFGLSSHVLGGGPRFVRFHPGELELPSLRYERAELWAHGGERTMTPVSTFRVDDLDVRVFATDGQLGEAAAADAADAIRVAVERAGRANVMLATGNSQFAFLDALTARDDVAWDRITGFHMDEYVGMDDTHPASFARYMRERVVDVVHPWAFHYIDGTNDAAAECTRYADLLREHPLDLCCLGVGENGHLAFNDPPFADFDDVQDVKEVELDDASRRQQVGEGHFRGLDDVPRTAITVTIPALLRAKRVLAIVPEARKAEAVRCALEEPIATSCPASVLRRTPHATLYLDQASASNISNA
jgi:glucosamine-6-phosphate deaminase